MLKPIKFFARTESGETYEGQIELPDQIAIERNFDCSILTLFSEHSAERLAYGAWCHLKRKKKIPDATEFDPWFNTLVKIDDSATGSLEEVEDPKVEETVQPPAGSPSSPID